MHEGKWSGSCGTLLMLLTSLSLEYPVPQCSAHLLMIKQFTENFQLGPVEASQRFWPNPQSLQRREWGNYFLSLWVRSSNCRGQSNSLSEGLDITQSSVTRVSTLRCTPRVGTLGRVEIYGVKFKVTWVWMTKSLAQAAILIHLRLPFPVHHLSHNLLFLHWYRRVLFVLWWDGKVVRPGGG